VIRETNGVVRAYVGNTQQFRVQSREWKEGGKEGEKEGRRDLKEGTGHRLN
jgi:hypothetical protein